jgi:hypothetical protein
VTAAAIATYLATIGAELYGYRQRLTGGERAVVQILAVDRDQAQVAFRYCRAFFDHPILAKLLKRETADTLELTNGLMIEKAALADRERVQQVEGLQAHRNTVRQAGPKLSGVSLPCSSPRMVDLMSLDLNAKVSEQSGPVVAPTGT